MCQGGVERGGYAGLVTLDLRGVCQPPVGFDGRAEIHRARLGGGLVADGNDNIRRVVFKGVIALAAQAVNADAGFLQGHQAAGQHLAPGKAASTDGLEPLRRQMVEHGFGQDAATAIGGTHKQNAHGICSLRG